MMLALFSPLFLRFFSHQLLALLSKFLCIEREIDKGKKFLYIQLRFQFSRRETCFSYVKESLLSMISCIVLCNVS